MDTLRGQGNRFPAVPLGQPGGSVPIPLGPSFKICCQDASFSEGKGSDYGPLLSSSTMVSRINKAEGPHTPCVQLTPTWNVPKQFREKKCNSPGGLYFAWSAQVNFQFNLHPLMIFWRGIRVRGDIEVASHISGKYFSRGGPHQASSDEIADGIV